MSSHKSRLTKLEIQIMPQKKNYLCVIMEGCAAGWDTPEETAKGYKIQPLMDKKGHIEGEPFYIATEAELNTFAERPDVNLSIVQIGTEESL